MEEIHGGCSCGAVAFQFLVKELNAYQCHCSICRKASGSAFTTTTMVPEHSFKWLRGVDGMTTYTKDNGYRVNFCSVCGSPVPNRFRDYPLFSVPVGSLEGAPPVKVVARIFLGSRAHWDDGPMIGQSFDEMPGLDEMLALLGVRS